MKAIVLKSVIDFSRHAAIWLTGSEGARVFCADVGEAAQQGRVENLQRGFRP